MHQTLYSKSTGTGITKQQNVSLQIPLPDSKNGFYSSQITTTDSVPNKLNENAKLNFLSENNNYYNRKHSTEQNRKNYKTLKLETEKYPKKLIGLQGESISPKINLKRL